MTTPIIIARSLSLVALLAAPAAALAQDAPAEPVPGNESGRLDAEPGDSALRTAARAALAVPHAVVTLVFAPAEGAAWAFERYQLADRAESLFWNDAGTIGLFPTFALESGFGINYGARFVHLDTFGAHEHLDLRASRGGRFHEHVAASFRSGERFGKRFSLGIAGELERRPKDTFYGVGNTDEQMSEVAIDPLADEMASAASYRHRLLRATVDFDARVVGDLHVRGAGALADHRFAAADAGPAIDEVFQADRLIGFGGVRNAYAELELRYDSRRRASAWDPEAIPAAGWLAAGFAGRVTSLDDGADFWRYGVDLQRFVAISRGPRVLSLRSHAEAVTGARDDVPFIELPRLGGGNLLRGYPVDRFRDRVAVSGSAEYEWDLSRQLSASVFVDAGRVAPSVQRLDLSDLRVGYGVSVYAHSEHSFVARATLASSIDGGVFLSLALDPVFELQGRTERR